MPHRNASIPCPECGKLFVYHDSMERHRKGYVNILEEPGFSEACYALQEFEIKIGKRAR